MVAAWWPCTLYAEHPSISKPKVYSVPGHQLAEAERKKDEIDHKRLLYILAESIICFCLFDLHYESVQKHVPCFKIKKKKIS